MDNIGDLSAIWQIVLNNIRDESSMPETAIDLWFGKFKMVSLSTDKVIFASDSEMKRGIITDKYSEFLADHVYRVIGFKPEVEIVVDPMLSPITHKMRQIRAGETVSEPDFEVTEPDFIFVGEDDVEEEYEEITDFGDYSAADAEARWGSMDFDQLVVEMEGLVSRGKRFFFSKTKRVVNGHNALHIGA